MAQRLEVRVAQQARDIVLAAGEVIVDAQHVVALGNQALAQMRTEEPGTAGDENPLGHDTHGIARFMPAPAIGAARCAGRPMLR